MSPQKDPKLVAFVQAVRQRKVLYDYRLEKYKDEEYKNKVWATLAKDCGYENADEARSAWNDLYKAFMICYRNELIRLARANFNENEISLPQELESDTKGNWNYYSEMRFIAPFRSKKDPELERLIQLVKPIVLRSSQAQSSNAMVISTAIVSAETQTPAENVHMDIPPIVEDNLSEKEMCLRSFFDAMFRATNSLPVRLQNKVKRDILQSINDAEIAAEAVKRLKGLNK